MYGFFSIKLPPTSKGDVDDGKSIDINIGKGQDQTQKNPFPYLGFNLIEGMN